MLLFFFFPAPLLIKLNPARHRRRLRGVCQRPRTATVALITVSRPAAQRQRQRQCGRASANDDLRFEVFTSITPSGSTCTARFGVPVRRKRSTLQTHRGLVNTFLFILLFNLRHSDSVSKLSPHADAHAGCRVHAEPEGGAITSQCEDTLANQTPEGGQSRVDSDSNGTASAEQVK